jgi:hypothetical protein
MSSDDVAYYRQRAEREREMANVASRADIAEIHLELARAYEALIEHKSLRPKLSIVVSG